jgi:ATP-dependent Clp protease ATP-binding subunit ClpA
MLAQNDHPEWGARPLRRIIQKNLREPLADWILTTAPPKGAKVGVDAGEGGLTFSY